jgi:hypothetical protein
MGDIWPYGPPKYVAFNTARAYLASVGFGSNDTLIGAAVGMAESSLDLTVINDTPSTGDYSVGVWQINYYGSLYAGRAAEFGSPRTLIAHGIQGQAEACYRVHLQQGWSAWSTYNSGAYLKYTGGKAPPPGGPSAQGGGPSTAISPPTEDYSATIKAAGVSVHDLGASWQLAARALANLGK